MKEKQPSIERREHEPTVKYAWMFDVDGVLTHPSEKRVTEPELFLELAQRLNNGEPVMLNTGRAVDFMIEKIIIPLEEAISDKKLLRNLFAVGEKGAVCILYDDSGQRVEIIDESISVPNELKAEAQKLIEEKFTDVVFYDATKKTMISIEMLDGLKVEDFQRRQPEINGALSEMLIRHGLTDAFKVDPTRIATDVENKHVGKALGAQKALWWLNERKIIPEKFIAFGDSSSDVAMADELHNNGLPVEFVFVGKKELIADKRLTFPVTYTIEQCEAGTLEYLKRKKS